MVWQSINDIFSSWNFIPTPYLTIQEQLNKNYYNFNYVMYIFIIIHFKY